MRGEMQARFLGRSDRRLRHAAIAATFVTAVIDKAKYLFTYYCKIVGVSMTYCEPSKELNAIGTKVLDAAYIVHRRLGPGLLEHVYQAAMCKELTKMGLKVQAEVYIPITYNDLVIDNAYRIDILVEEQVVVEVKTVEKFSPLHFRQIRTYLRLSHNQLGYLLNFNTVLMTDGIERQIMSETSD